MLLTSAEKRLRCLGHVQRRDAVYVWNRMLKMEVPGKREGGRPQRRFMDVVRTNMPAMDMAEDAEDRR